MNTKKLILLSLAVGLISKVAYGCGETHAKDKAYCDKIYSKMDLTREPDGVFQYCTKVYLGKCDKNKVVFPKKEAIATTDVNKGTTPWK